MERQEEQHMLLMSSRSRLTSLLRATFDASREARARKIPLQEVLQERQERAVACITRREFMVSGAIVTAGLTLGLPVRSSASSEKIVVVGAGFAGLRFAHAMWTRRRIPCQIYEANSRLGGRVWTNRNFFAGVQIAEHGAEFISSEHKSALHLVKRFGLKLQVVYGGSEPCCDDINWLDGEYYTMGQLNSDLSKLQPLLDEAYNSAPVTHYNNYTPAGYRLDHTSASEWLAQNTVGGLNSRLARILQTALLSEYGLEPNLQSSLNLIYLLGGPASGSGLAGTDEKYHVVGE
jgi:monoamine oxidase